MHIVDVCAFYTPHGGGVKTYVERKLAVLPQMGATITILAPGKHDATEERGDGACIRYLRAPSFPLDRRYRYFDDEAALHAALSDLCPDVVEASSPWSSASMVARWNGRAVRSLVMHADPLSAYAYRWFGSIMPRPWIDRAFGTFWRHLRRLDADFDTILCANASLTDRLRRGGVVHARTNPMGVADRIFTPILRDTALRRQMLARCGLPEDALLLLGVGRFAAEKRWPMVIDAVRRASRNCAVGLILIGDGPERRLIQRHHAADPHVRIMPPVHDRPYLARLLASADALVHGCEAETFGMIAAEARASGLPIIVPDQGGARDQLVPGAGLLYDAGSAQGLAEAILRFSAMNRDAIRETAMEAAEGTRFIEHHFRDLLRHYDALAEGERRAA
ncbi:MAG: glycosyltransferase [Sphingobium sp.]|jgi:alpha-1,6-mannosyltransferase|nr:glycosyltransferase [Sphingobium sp.]MCI1270435.1 glycosyltransferase [Sphingobium sp.]MCI1755599.1 glycosyltransferase [Sphingobium sp.]MCI2052978.1 glycosyltransferase [Sphingobium sp.]